jgi:hypothetical protein
MHPSLNIDESTLARFCQAHPIRRIGLFGLRLKGTARPDSDIDWRVAFEAVHTSGLMKLAAVEYTLSDLLNGQKVDLRTPTDLSRYFRSDVVRTARVQYER